MCVCPVGRLSLGPPEKGGENGPEKLLTATVSVFLSVCPEPGSSLASRPGPGRECGSWDHDSVLLGVGCRMGDPKGSPAQLFSHLVVGLHIILPEGGHGGRPALSSGAWAGTVGAAWEQAFGESPRRRAEKGGGGADSRHARKAKPVTSSPKIALLSPSAGWGRLERWVSGPGPQGCPTRCPRCLSLLQDVSRLLQPEESPQAPPNPAPRPQPPQVKLTPK